MARQYRQVAWFAAIATLALILIAGCQPVEPVPTPDAVEAAATSETVVDEFVAAYPIAVTAWSLDFFGPPDEPLEKLPDTRASVVYFFDRYAGFDGCNYFLGVYEADGEGVLRMNTPARTNVFCEADGINQQAELFLTSLLNVTEYEMTEEQLIANTVNDQRLLTLEPGTPLPVVDTEWELKFWWHADREQWIPVLPTSSTTLTIDAAGQASGSGGCNNYTTTAEGELQIEKVLEATDTYAELPTVSFGPVAAQMMACTEPDGIMDQEQNYFIALDSTAYYFKLGGLLLMLDANDEPLLMFAARN